MPGTPPPTPSALASPRAIARVVITAVAVVFALYLIYLVRKPLTWVFIAGFLAIALTGPVNILSRHMRRGLAITLVYIALILVPIGFAAILIPPLVTQGNTLVQNLPQYAGDFSDFVQRNPTLRRLERDYDITGALERQARRLPARIGDAAGVLGNIGVSVVNSLFAGFTILVLSVFLVGSGRRWLHALAATQSPEYAEWLRRLFGRIGNAVGNYVAGALTQALLAGVTGWLVLTILGVPYSAALGVLIALFDLVPLVGATIAAVLVGIVTVFNDFPTDTIVWTVWAIVYQQIENTVIQPRIQARAVQVHPFVVLVSVLFGSTLFGIIGALLAIPAAAALQIAIYEYSTFKRRSRILPANEFVAPSQDPSEPTGSATIELPPSARQPS
jgi:predicted PurR-regulated permease PerM